MSALGDRLREEANRARKQDGFSTTRLAAYQHAADLADEYDDSVFVESAQGRGPHAAAALRWAAEQIDGWRQALEPLREERPTVEADVAAAVYQSAAGTFRRLATEAEREQDPARDYWL